MKFIDRNFHDSSLSLLTVSGSAGLSLWYLSRSFPLHVGIGYRDYLRLIRLRQAAKLLTTTPICIKGIASSVGYKHLSDFYRHFKTEYKSSPAEFRRKRTEIICLPDLY